MHFLFNYKSDFSKILFTAFQKGCYFNTRINVYNLMCDAIVYGSELTGIVVVLL